MPWLEPADPFAKPPKLKLPATLAEVAIDDLERGDTWLDVSSAHVRDDVLIATDVDTVEIVRSRLTGVRLVVGPETTVIIRDSLLERCDLSGLRSESILRSEFVGCKMAGAEFAGVVTDSRFVGCSIRLANLSMCRLTRVAFVDGELFESDMFESKLIDVSVVGCAITDLNLDRATCERVDLRDAEQLGLKVAPDLSGCLVTPAQVQEIALWLAHQLGLSIESG